MNLLSPERRRRAVVVLQDRFRVSQRRACRLAGQNGTTQRRPVPVVNIAEQLLRRLGLRAGVPYLPVGSSPLEQAGAWVPARRAPAVCSEAPGSPRPMWLQLTFHAFSALPTSHESLGWPADR